MLQSLVSEKTEMKLATKVTVTGRKNGRKQNYCRYTIEGYRDVLFSFRFQTGKDHPPCSSDVHARYVTKSGDRTASFYPDAVPND